MKPAVLANGYYVRPRSVLHSDHCNICRPPGEDIKTGGFDISYVIEIRNYLDTVGGGIKKVIITGGWNNDKENDKN